MKDLIMKMIDENIALIKKGKVSTCYTPSSFMDVSRILTEANKSEKLQNSKYYTIAVFMYNIIAMLWLITPLILGTIYIIKNVL